MPGKNLKAIRGANFLSAPQLQLATALWLVKKEFDRRRSSNTVLAESDLHLIAEVFHSHWFRIDHCTINLGHTPLSEKYAKNKKLIRESKARLFEVTDWLSAMGFHKVDEFYTKTARSGMNSHVMSKGEINFALNEGIDQAGLRPAEAGYGTAKAGESQISDYVNAWGEGIQHIAVDARVVTPENFGKTKLKALGLNLLDVGTDGFRIKFLAAVLQKAGFTFLTKIYNGVATDGQKLWQCFTDEIDRGFFFELIERGGERGRFVPGTVQGLYEDIEKKQLQK